MPRPPVPQSLRQFQAQFASEKRCADYLAGCRWPEGFACRQCGHARAYALLLQRQLAISRYETAWMILHTLCRAMVNAAREHLRGEIELDEIWVGGTEAGLRGSRQLKGRKAALVLVAVERRRRASGRVRMQVIPDFGGGSIRGFAARNITLGAPSTPMGSSLRGARRGRLRARPTIVATPLRLRQGAKSVVSLADR